MASRAVYRAYRCGRFVAEGSKFEVAKALGLSVVTVTDYIKSPGKTRNYRFERVR